MPWRWAGLLPFALILPACTLTLDGEQVRLCRQTLPAVAPPEAALTVTGVSAATVPYEIRIDYGAATAGREQQHRVLCAFTREGVGAGRHLAAFAADEEPYTPIRVFMLDSFWLHRGDAAAAADPGPGTAEVPPLAVSRPAAIAVQALLDGLPRTGLTVLVAAAYGLVYGVVGRVNLAFNAIAALGAVGAGLAVVLVRPLSQPFGILAAVVLAGGGLAAVYGFVLHRLVFAALAFRSGQAALVATLAVAIALSEFLLVAQGAAGRALPALLDGRLAVAGGEGFVATISAMGFATTVIAAALSLMLVAGLRLTQFGRRWRAVAQDPLMASWLGVSPAAVLAASVVVASALAGVSGSLATASVGQLDVTVGARFGLTALLASVIGGVGSVEGAMLGAVVIGLVESAWGLWLPLGQRDAAVLAVAVLVVMLKPGGLLGSNR